MDFQLNAGLFAIGQQVSALDPATVYDVIIIGGGPSGLTAAVYALRKGLKTGLVTLNIGGQMAETTGIENYLGYRYIQGPELIEKFREQVVEFGIDLQREVQVTRIEKGDPHVIHLDSGQRLHSQTVIIASGSQPKRLDIPGERELVGHGVTYCAICDAPFYAGQDVVVVGGGNSGLTAAIDLAKLATRVTLVQRRDRLIADQVLVDKLAEHQNVQYLLEHELSQISGTGHVKEVEAVCLKSGRKTRIQTSGVFVEIGLTPNSGFARDLVAMNAFDEIVVDFNCRTDVAGVFAAGDVTTVPYKQIIVACGEGAKAALSAADYLLNKR